MRAGAYNDDAPQHTPCAAPVADAARAAQQYARFATGAFFNFNGTAGVWRRACIEKAGGWNARTTVEDMDLSLRAYLQGWRFVFLHDVTVRVAQRLRRAASATAGVLTLSHCRMCARPSAVPERAAEQL